MTATAPATHFFFALCAALPSISGLNFLVAQLGAIALQNSSIELEPPSCGSRFLAVRAA